jgi:hypothetical protein
MILLITITIAIVSKGVDNMYSYFSKRISLLQAEIAMIRLNNKDG